MKKDDVKPYALIDDIAKLFSLYVARETERAGIAYGYRKLLACLSHGEEVPQLDVIAEANLTPATVSSTFAKLQAEGIVARRFDPKDRRKYYVRLTEKGKKRWQQIQSRSDELGEIMLEGMTKKEREQLSATLAKMLEKLKEKGDKAVEADKVP